MALLAGTPLAAARAQVDSAVDLVVAVDRDGPHRRVTEVVRVAAGDTRVLAPAWRA
jgi:Flp pilus assembly CpaF family ATPase